MPFNSGWPFSNYSCVPVVPLFRGTLWLIRQRIMWQNGVLPAQARISDGFQIKFSPLPFRVERKFYTRGKLTLFN